MMAKAFSAFLADGGVVIFASGVSDSLEDRREAFDREKSLLLRTLEDNAGKLVVYFGTCSAVEGNCGLLKRQAVGPCIGNWRRIRRRRIAATSAASA